MVVQMLLCGQRYENVLYGFKCKRFRNTRHTFWNIILKLFFKHPALPVKFTLNRNYPR
jgi:hypothetical protein